MRSGVLCFYRIGICIFLKRDSELRRTSEEIFFLYTSNPSPKKLPYLRCLPYITNVTPRNATRHSRREVDIRFCFLFCQYFFQPPRPTGTPPISSTMSRGRGLKCRFISFKLLHCRHFLTPPSFGHLPYILLCKTPRNTTGHSREEGGKYFPRIYFSNRRPLYRFATPRNAMGHGRGGGFKMPLQQ